MTNLTLDEKKALIRMALEAREQAYVPYSDFMVGAALRAEDGRIFTGCNVENAAFTPTSCAERTALFKAVSEGVTRFTDIAVVGSRRGEVNKQITSPCGVCRQAVAAVQALPGLHYFRFFQHRLHPADAGGIGADVLRQRFAAEGASTVAQADQRMDGQIKRTVHNHPSFTSS